jgi:hypothetical protein
MILFRSGRETSIGLNASTQGWDFWTNLTQLSPLSGVAIPAHQATMIKKKIKFSSYIRKFRQEWLQSHMLGRAF